MNEQSQIMKNQNYALRPPPPPPPPSPPENPVVFQSTKRPVFTAAPKQARNNWKGKKFDNCRHDQLGIGNSYTVSGSLGGSYKYPNSNKLQFQNRAKARRFYPKKKYNNRFAPFAPRNTTSFLIRAKKSGGIASLVSPYPATPAVLPTPIFSPSSEVLVDMANEEWGVDGYGSMKGLIRLRSLGHEAREEEEGGSSDSDVEEHVEVERRLDHDLSRFEMIYPNSGDELNSLLENTMDDQDAHIVQLEEENLTLKERLFLMERELEDLRRRVQFLETGPMENHEEESGNASGNDVGGDVCSEKSVGGGDVWSEKSVGNGDGETE